MFHAALLVFTGPILQPSFFHLSFAWQIPDSDMFPTTLVHFVIFVASLQSSHSVIQKVKFLNTLQSLPNFADFLKLGSISFSEGHMRQALSFCDYWAELKSYLQSAS